MNERGSGEVRGGTSQKRAVAVTGGPGHDRRHLVGRTQDEHGERCRDRDPKHGEREVAERGPGEQTEVGAHERVDSGGEQERHREHDREPGHAPVRR